MDIEWTAGLALAALELSPGEPSDVTNILKNPRNREALLALDAGSATDDLTAYLCRTLSFGRIEHFSKLVSSELAEQGSSVNVAGIDGYPSTLLRAWDAPPLLFKRGCWNVTPTVAIVGSRETDESALRASTNMAFDLASRGYGIVSGLALGVDTAAHEGALAASGYTVAVLGTGIKTIYPSVNADLADRISVNGAVVSQFSPDAPRTRTTFLRRNKVIAGLSESSLIMAGEDSSGSRHEIEHAISYGRTALMWRPALGQKPWAADLASRGLAHFVESVEDVVRCIEQAP